MTLHPSDMHSLYRIEARLTDSVDRQRRHRRDLSDGLRSQAKRRARLGGRTRYAISAATGLLIVLAAAFAG